MNDSDITPPIPSQNTIPTFPHLLLLPQTDTKLLPQQHSIPANLNHPRYLHSSYLV